MSLNHEECQEIRARHQPGALVTSAARCIRDGEPWPCDVTRLLDLAASAVNFTVVWQEVLPYVPDDYGFTMQCAEAEAAADLFRAVGDEKMADSVLDAHAVHDTEEDQHHERGVSVQHRRAGSERDAEPDSQRNAGWGNSVQGS